MSETVPPSAVPGELKLSAAKEIRGTVELPPNPDLFLLTLAACCACRRPVRVTPVERSPLWQRYASIFEGLLQIGFDQHSCDLLLRDDAAATVTLPGTDLPWIDAVLFLLLGMGKTVAVQACTPAQLEYWRQCAARLAIPLQTRIDQTEAVLYATVDVRLERDPEKAIDQQDVAALLGFGMGAQIPLQFRIEQPLVSPLRHLYTALGMSITVKSVIERDTSDIARHLRFMQPKKRSDNSQCFTVATSPATGSDLPPVTIELPGDDQLAALLLLAKSLVQKGNLVIGNMLLESWNCSTLSFIRKMGCKPAIQEQRITAFGTLGLVQMQKYTLAGRKCECTPAAHFIGQVPAIALLACFCEGQSILRNLETVRLSNPDRLAQLTRCLNVMDCRLGEMPDGLVIDGRSQYDGFDLRDEVPAVMAGACAIAGLRCIGTTAVHAHTILERWPAFKELLDGICEYRS